MILILVLALTLGWSDALLAQTPFYQGKTITIAVGTKAGDVYDLYPRLLAEFWTKNIPGNPNIIVQNVPGAASLIAANQVYNVAKPDGLSLAAIYPALYFDQLIKRPEVKYDWAKWNWIGSPVKSNQLLYMRADTPYKSMDEIRKAATAPKCGSTGIASAGYYIPKLLEEVLNTKFDIVSGQMNITSQAADVGEAGEMLPVEFAGPQITVGFNAQYLNEFFSVIQDGEVAFEFKDGNSQAQIRPQEDGDYDFRYVVMPMRL